MRLKVLIKLSSLIFLVSCAEAGPDTKAPAQGTSATVAATDSELYKSYDCASLPTKDWIGDDKRNKAFLHKALMNLNNLDISGKYVGKKSQLDQCEVSIVTDNKFFKIYTSDKKSVELNLTNSFKILGFSCSGSKLRYDLNYENPSYGNTVYISLAFSQNTNELKDVFFDSNNLGYSQGSYQCGALSKAGHF